MKLAVLLSRVPYPLEKGDKLRAYHQLRELSARHEIHLICLGDTPELSPEAHEKLLEICTDVHYFHLSKLGRYWQLFLAFFNGNPFQVAWFYRTTIRRKIERLCSTIQPDHIFCQLIRTTEFVRNLYHIPKTLDYQDAFSKGMERRMMRAGFFARLLFRSEMVRLQRYESLVFELFDEKCIITAQDRDYILHSRRREIAVVSNGVDTDFFHPAQRKEPRANQVVFTGNMAYAPNVVAARYLAKQVMPLVWKMQPEVELLLAGASPVPTVRALASERVTISGWLPDIRTAYAESAIFVAPMQMGTGLQNKLLEAMAMGMPCITFPLANKALGATPGEHLLIANNAEDTARCVLFLLENPGAADILGKNARQFVENQFNWTVTTAKLEDLFKKHAGQPLKVVHN